MARAATRLLTFLELLEAAPSVGGRAAAERLGVDVRTVRRYAVALGDLGIPVEGQRGTGGGYRLRPGHRVPPLMFSDDEAAAVVFGLMSTQRLGLTGADGALAKVRRVLPPVLRRRVEALEAAVAFTGDAGAVPPDPETLLVLADAARRRRAVRVHYTSADGDGRERAIAPYGVVVHAGRWYAAARDRGSGELRSFRLDRMRAAVLDEPTAPPPPGFDAVAHVERSLARIPWRWRVEVLVDAPLEELAARLPPTLAELAAAERGTLLRMRAASLEWAAQLLSGVGRPFVIHEPDELREHVQALAGLLAHAAVSG
jgi:predicted DNA-binding transcriptional regulator YafY